MPEVPKWLRIADGQILLNTEKTGEFFGVTRETLSAWSKRGAPKEARGWWNIRELMMWLGKMPASGSDGTVGEVSAEARKLHADAEYRELKAAREKIALEALMGQLMHRNEVAAEWARRIAELKTSLMALARKIAGQMPDPDTRRVVESVIANEVRDYLEQYSRAGKYTPAGPRKPQKAPKVVGGGVASVPAARAADSQRVGRQV